MGFEKKSGFSFAQGNLICWKVALFPIQALLLLKPQF